MPQQDLPDGLAGDGEPEEIPELPGGAMRPGLLARDDRGRLGGGEAGAGAAPPVPEPRRPPLPVALELPAHRPLAHIEQDLRGPAAQAAGQHLLHSLFLSASRVSSMLPSSPRTSAYPTGEADSLNLAKAVN